MIAKIIGIKNLKSGKEELEINSHDVFFLPDFGIKEGREFVMSKMATSERIQTEEVVRNFDILSDCIILRTDSREYTFVEIKNGL